MITVPEVLDLIEERTERFRHTGEAATRSGVRAYYDAIVATLEGLHEDLAILHYGKEEGHDCP